MRFPLPSPLLVVDLEATTADARTILESERETIEIGAVLADPVTGEVFDRFQCFVRPQRHPVLSSFCRRLTGITQADVDGGVSFPNALLALHATMVEGRCSAWASWGTFDRTQIQRDCTLHGLRSPLPAHVDLEEVFAKARRLRQRAGLAKALTLAELPAEGKAHRALDDAINAARMLPFMQPTPRAAG